MHPHLKRWKELFLIKLLLHSSISLTVLDVFLLLLLLLFPQHQLSFTNRGVVETLEWEFGTENADGKGKVVVVAARDGSDAPPYIESLDSDAPQVLELAVRQESRDHLVVLQRVRVLDQHFAFSFQVQSEPSTTGLKCVPRDGVRQNPLREPKGLDPLVRICCCQWVAGGSRRREIRRCRHHTKNKSSSNRCQEHPFSHHQILQYCFSLSLSSACMHALVVAKFSNSFFPEILVLWSISYGKKWLTKMDIYLWMSCTATITTKENSSVFWQNKQLGARNLGSSRAPGSERIPVQQRQVKQSGMEERQKNKT